MTDPQPTFECDDLYASSFIATKCRLLSTRQTGSHTNFVFENDGNRAAIASLAYLNGEPVGIRDYVSAHRQLKAVAYASRKTGL